MIPKGNQRGGGQQLATHLLNELENDRVEVMELKGSIANDLNGAFAEWEATATGTKCKKFLYSLSINPDQTQGPLTREQYLDFIARTENHMGLTDQPRAIVFHVKQGREHCHVIWSRIDTDRMKAVHLAHDRQKLRTIAQEFARDHGLQLPHGMRKDRGKDRFKDRNKHKNLGEMQQEERTGLTKQQRQKEITEAWRKSDSGKAFLRALEERGYLLARGDKRGYVVVDRFGEIHSLPRQIDGVSTKEIKTMLAPYPPEKLPPALKAQAFVRERQQIKLKEQFRIQASEKRAALARTHQKRRSPLTKKKASLEKRHAAQLQMLLERQKKQNEKIADTRRDREGKGLAAFLGRVTGISKLLKKRYEKQDQKRTTRQEKAVEAIQRRQLRELREVSRQDRALQAIEKRELRSLEVRLRREIFAKEPARKIPAPEQQLTAEQQRKAQLFRENAQDMGKPEKKEPKTGISDKFAEALKARAEEKKRQQDKSRDRGRGGPTPH